MIKKTVSIDFDEGVVIVDKGVKLNVGMIKKVIFDRDNNIGEVICEDAGTMNFYISLKSAYALIIFLGTQSWVNL